MAKQFKVVAVTSSRNSFGLLGFVMVARDGEAVQAAGNDIVAGEYPRGSIVSLRGDALDGLTDLGFEIPEYLPECPPRVAAKVWA